MSSFGLDPFQGPAGPTGPTGPQGASLRIKGTVANSAALPIQPQPLDDAYITNDTGNLWVSSGSVWTNVGPFRGQTGLTGATGPAGPIGATGLTGPSGPSGATGPIGQTGATGPAGPSGPSGATGPIGSTGATGPIGQTGATGPIGSSGATGPVGSSGPAGANGTVGSTGATGPSGTISNSIYSAGPISLGNGANTTLDFTAIPQLANSSAIYLVTMRSSNVYRNHSCLILYDKGGSFTGSRPSITLLTGMQNLSVANSNQTSYNYLDSQDYVLFATNYSNGNPPDRTILDFVNYTQGSGDDFFWYIFKLADLSSTFA